MVSCEAVPSQYPVKKDICSVKKLHNCLPLCLLVSVLLSAPSFAMTGKGHGKCANCHTMTVSEASALMKSIGGTVKYVKLSPVAGLFELTIENNGRQGTAYVDFAKKHVMPGPVFDLATGKTINQPSAKAPSPARRVDIGKITKDNSIIMGNPKGKKKLFVFTDPDCPFCAKLHPELKKLAAQDRSLVIYVKMFPLQVHPKAFDKAKVILGRGSAELLDKAFAGQPLPPLGPLDYRKPVDDTIALATSLGITATPTLVMPDGRLVQGYYDVATLRQYIDGKK